MISSLAVSASAQTDAPRDCLKLRMENGWSRAEFRECKLEESRKRTAQLDVEFAQMRDWLRARGLDVNEAGYIIDPQGRTLAQIKASNKELAEYNASLRSDISALELSIETSRAEYQKILKEFEQAILKGE